MNKNFFALLIALCVSTAPICAEITSTSPNITISDETTSSSTTHSETRKWSLSPMQMLKALGVLYTCAGVGLMTIAYNAPLSNQYEASKDAINGAIIAALGLWCYSVASEEDALDAEDC
jgi:uncharacterized membrane protein